MQSLGMLALGTFIGWVVSYGLLQVTNWANPGNVFSAVISAAVAGGVFTFIQFLGGPNLGTALFMYPLGLAYGALCAALIWVGQERTLVMILHILGFTVASALLLALLPALLPALLLARQGVGLDEAACLDGVHAGSSSL